MTIEVEIMTVPTVFDDDINRIVRYDDDEKIDERRGATMAETMK